MEDLGCGNPVLPTCFENVKAIICFALHQVLIAKPCAQRTCVVPLFKCQSDPIGNGAEGGLYFRREDLALENMLRVSIHLGLECKLPLGGPTSLPSSWYSSTVCSFKTAVYRVSRAFLLVRSPNLPPPRPRRVAMLQQKAYLRPAMSSQMMWAALDSDPRYAWDCSPSTGTHHMLARKILLCLRPEGHERRLAR